MTEPHSIPEPMGSGPGAPSPPTAVAAPEEFGDLLDTIDRMTGPELRRFTTRLFERFPHLTVDDDDREC